MALLRYSVITSFRPGVVTIGQNGDMMRCGGTCLANRGDDEEGDAAYVDLELFFKNLP